MTVPTPEMDVDPPAGPRLIGAYSDGYPSFTYVQLLTSKRFLFFALTHLWLELAHLDLLF